MSTGSDFGRREYDATITYDVKELLADIKTQQAVGFAELKTKLDTKADKSDLARMEVRLDNHATRLHDVERTLQKTEVKETVHKSIGERTWSRKKQVLAGLSAFALFLATLFGPYFAAHGF